MAYLINKIRYSMSSTIPAGAPVSVDECKSMLEISDDVHNSKLLTMLMSATSEAEKYTGSLFVPRTTTLNYDRVERYYRLPVYPVRAIDSIEYLSGGSYTAFTDFQDDLDDLPPLVKFNSLPGADISLKTVKFTLSTGYTSIALIPDDIKQAILFHVYQSFLTRGEFSDISLRTFRNLLQPYRVLGI